MWKVGDELVFIKEGEYDSTCEEFTIGQKYEIIEVERMRPGHVEHHNYYYKDGFKYWVKNDDGDDWYIEQDSFILYKEKIIPETEVDYLDCFKENFKNGY